MSEPVLVLLPDAEARVDLARPVLGAPPAVRLAESARRAGFGAIVLAPGTCTQVPGSIAMSSGDPVGAPALVAFESAVIAEALLRLMVEHPLAADEGFSLGDAAGRPSAWFCGRLARVPAEMPISEEIDWPEGRGPDDLARLVYAEDRARVEAVIWSDRDPDGAAALAVPGAPRRADRRAGGRAPAAFAVPPAFARLSRAALRRLADSGRPLGQIELAAVSLAVLSGVAGLIEGGLGVFLGAALLCAAVQLAALLPALARLVGERGGPADALWLQPAVRPFGHAAYGSVLTYALVAERGRSSVAGLVLLALGAGAVVLSLAHARDVLRGERPRFELPGAEAFAARVGAQLPGWLRTDVRIELAALALALPGAPGLPWGVLVAAALARLWGWYVAPRG